VAELGMARGESFTETTVHLLCNDIGEQASLLPEWKVWTGYKLEA